MTRLSTALTRSRALHRELRNRRASDRALQRALAAAPTQESAHEIAAVATRR